MEAIISQPREVFSPVVFQENEHPWRFGLWALDKRYFGAIRVRYADIGAINTDLGIILGSIPFDDVASVEFFVP